jgi:hypothetical protein
VSSLELPNSVRPVAAVALARRRARVYIRSVLMKIRMIRNPPPLVAANDDWRIHRCCDGYGQLHLFDTWIDPDEIWGEAMNRAAHRVVEKRRRLGLPPLAPVPIPPGKYPSLRQACETAIGDLAREHPEWAPMRIID